jgi:hypothetical protein
MPSKTWGRPLNIKEYIVVGGSEEIPKGQKAYVFGYQGTGVRSIPAEKWNALQAGNMAQIKSEIENSIPGSKVVYVAISWDKATLEIIPRPQGEDIENYLVEGFRVEAIVENVQGGLTGLEIVSIIMAVAFLVAVAAILITSGWVIWRVISAAEQLGPAATIGVGLVVLVLLFILLLVMFGGKAEFKGKKRRFKIGKS